MKALCIAMVAQVVYMAVIDFYVLYVGEPPTWTYVLFVASVLAMPSELHAIGWLLTERGRVPQTPKPQRGGACSMGGHGGLIA